MAFRREQKVKSNFTQISIGLASPEEILERSSGEVLKLRRSITVLISPNGTAFFAKGFSVPLKIMSVTAENTSASVTGALCVTVVEWKLLRRRCDVKE